MSWQAIRQKLQRCSERDLIGLIGDLYKLNKENQRFLQARFTATENEIDLSFFKKIIALIMCAQSPLIHYVYQSHGKQLVIIERQPAI